MAEKRDPKESLLQSLQDTGNQVALKAIVRNGSVDTFQFPAFPVSGRTGTKVDEERNAHIHQLEQQIAAAQKTIADLKKEVTQKSEMARKQGYEEGLSAGISDGIASSNKEWEAKLALWQADLAKTIQSMNNAYGERIQQTEAQCLELAIGLARRIFCVEAEKYPEHIQVVIAEAFAHIGQAETVILHLNPLDSDNARRAQNFWQPINSALKSVHIESDPRVERGGCWIESVGGGTIDLRAPVILERMENAARESFRQFTDNSAHELPVAS